ncbi:MAG: hypothetical protein ACYDHH_16975 [Solirubrobacteraceae bacterium]
MPWVLSLIAGRARRAPGRRLLAGLGIAVAVAFAGGVVAQGTISGDQAARALLAGQGQLATAVRVTSSGQLNATVVGAARAALAPLRPVLDRHGSTEVLLLAPVRLSGRLVQLAALAPLSSWLDGAASASAAQLGPCRPRSCPVIATRPLRARVLAAYGVKLKVAGTQPLRSAVPLGFAPAYRSPSRAALGTSLPPVLLSGDVRGLGSLAALSGLYRTVSWVAELDSSRLHSWQLAGLEHQLSLAQARLTGEGGQFSFSGPFAALDAARAEAAAAPRRLLLLGGGAVAVLAMFIVLAAGGLRAEQQAEVGRLLASGARRSQCALFVIVESATIAVLCTAAGALAGVLVAALRADRAGLPVAGVLSHSVLTATAVLVLAVGWLIGTALLVLVLAAPSSVRRIADALAVAALAALVALLAPGATWGGTTALLVVPLCCLAAAVLLARLATGALRLLERPARRGPPLVRLSLVSLSRSPGAPAIAIAFVMVSVALAGFALCYRATLLRGTADQAAYRVPLDATVSPAPNFATPLGLAPLARWQALAGGVVLPVRRTYATYLGAGASVTIPALGVPARSLALIHGWRQSDGSAPLGVLARRLRPPGAAPAGGPRLPRARGWLAVRAASALGLTLTADLLGPGDTLRQLGVGTIGASPRILRVRTPPGDWALAAFELDEPTGLKITNGHQNGENPAAATQASTPVSLGPLTVIGDGSSRGGLSGGALGALSGGAPGGSSRVGLAGWRGLGAAANLRDPSAGRGALRLRFSETGFPGLVRPRQPSDVRPVPVLVDRQTAASAAAGGHLALEVDGLPVRAVIAGVLRRFPTIPDGTGGFVVADQQTLAAALDAELPGQGRPDELWIASKRLRRLREALATPSLDGLGAAFRSSLEQRARAAPIARAVLGTLVAAVIVSAVLAVLGLLATLLGPSRDRLAERDLSEQGAGPARLRAELQLRTALTILAGVLAGVGLAILLARLAVASVRAASTVTAPQPPLVTIVPAGALALTAAAALALLGGAGWLATRMALR